MLIIGILFGAGLSLLLAMLYVLSLGGEFRDSLRLAALELRDRLTGRRPPPAPAAEQAPPPPDPRIRGLQEELRMANRLLEKARGERLAIVEQAERASAETAQLNEAIAEGERRIAALGEEVTAERNRAEQLRALLGERCEELARANRDVRDLRNELELLNPDAAAVNG